MSKDYERLYDHLLGGGEALGYTWSDPNDVRTRTAASISFVGGRFAQIEYIDDFGTVDAFETDEGALPFIAECQRLNLEWIAPAPAQVGPTIDRIIEVVEKVLSNGNYLDPVFDPKDLKLMDADLHKRLSSLFR